MFLTNENACAHVEEFALEGGTHPSNRIDFETDSGCGIIHFGKVKAEVWSQSCVAPKAFCMLTAFHSGFDYSVSHSAGSS